MKAYVLDATWDPRPDYTPSPVELETRRALIGSSVWRHLTASFGEIADPDARSRRRDHQAAARGLLRIGPPLLRVGRRRLHQIPRARPLSKRARPRAGGRRRRGRQERHAHQGGRAGHDRGHGALRDVLRLPDQPAEPLRQPRRGGLQHQRRLRRVRARAGAQLLVDRGHPRPGGERGGAVRLRRARRAVHRRL